MPESCASCWWKLVKLGDRHGHRSANPPRTICDVRATADSHGGAGFSFPEFHLLADVHWARPHNRRDQHRNAGGEPWPARQYSDSASGGLGHLLRENRSAWTATFAVSAGTPIGGSSVVLAGRESDCAAEWGSARKPRPGAFDGGNLEQCDVRGAGGHVRVSAGMFAWGGNASGNDHGISAGVRVANFCLFGMVVFRAADGGVLDGCGTGIIRHTGRDCDFDATRDSRR